MQVRGWDQDKIIGKGGIQSKTKIYRTGGNIFEGGKFRAIQDCVLLKISRVLIPPSTCIIINNSSATHKKREIKNTSKFFTRTVFNSRKNKFYMWMRSCMGSVELEF